MANPTVPDFTDVAARKLADLLEKGFVITGYCFERQVEGTQPQRGFVDFAGFVGWHQPNDIHPDVRSGYAQGWQDGMAEAVHLLGVADE